MYGYGYRNTFKRVGSGLPTPDQIFGANLYDWWDFPDLATQSITGGLIDSITSKGTNAGVFASSGTERPASIVGVNGLNVADFDGVNDFMQVAASTGMYNFLHNGSLGTVIMINRIADAAPDNAQAFLNNNELGISSIGFGINFDDRNSLSRNEVIANSITNGVNRVVTNISGNNQFPTQQYNMLMSKIDADASPVADRSIINTNGGIEIKNNTQTLAPSLLNATDNMTLGVVSNGGSLYLKGQLPEIYILNGIHPTPTQLTQLNAYLTNKYGGTFPIV